MKGKQIIQTGLAALLILFAQSCYYDNAALLNPDNNQTLDCNTVPAKFAANVLPLITSKCATSGCHNAAGAAGGVVFTNYAQISAAKDRINTRAVVEKSMPSSGPLLPAEVNIIRCWIEGGALNN